MDLYKGVNVVCDDELEFRVAKWEGFTTTTYDSAPTDAVGAIKFAANLASGHRLPLHICEQAVPYIEEMGDNN